MPNGDDKGDLRGLAGRVQGWKRVRLKAGTRTEPRTHGAEQFMMVVEGHGVLMLESCVVELLPGVVVHFEPGVVCEARFDTDAVVYTAGDEG
ncbi:cupin domain-containing protein [Acidocella sp.]|uniref:cupin domain-containing protein n=1 Tax=Acidocella sp. TaxID=50710 RepID=UPI002617FE02|nr:cupin domain-containing protein [Acidocella sp.]